jgi:hypothetical protein
VQSDMMLRVSRSAGAFAPQIGLPTLYVCYEIKFLDQQST